MRTNFKSMRLIKIWIIFVLFPQVFMAQNTCKKFEDYESSQYWVKTLKNESHENRKFQILERIACEQKSKQADIDFALTIIINGSEFFSASDIPKKRNRILNLISAKNYNCISV